MYNNTFSYLKTHHPIKNNDNNDTHIIKVTI